VIERVLVSTKDSPVPDPESLHLLVPDISISAWTIWVSLDRQVLPYGGGFLDQPDDLMTDLLTLDSMAAAMQRGMDEDEE